MRHYVALFFSRVMRTSFARRLVSPYYPAVEKRLFQLSGGRFQLSSLLTPVLILITIGAKSGLERETPLVCWPQPEQTFLVSGSNWGKPSHPAWTANLIAHPDAEIIHRRRRIAVRAELLAGAERDAAWPVLEAQLPEYREYERISGRQVRIFRLTPAA